jgi:hypothetical protein
MRLLTLVVLGQLLATLLAFLISETAPDIQARTSATRLIEQFLLFPVNLTTVSGLYQQALALADAYALPAAYDAHYAALAQILGCNLWTDDQRLLGLLAGRLAFVRWIGDYQAGDPV